MPVLYCRDPLKRTEWRVEILADTFTLGCAEKASVPLPDRDLAALEAIVCRRGDDYVVRDAAGAGRVFVNDALAREGILKDGDCLRAGRVAMIFYSAAPPAGADPSELLEKAARTGLAPEARGRKISPLPRRSVLWAGAALGAGMGLGILLGLWEKSLRTSIPPRESGSGTAASVKTGEHADSGREASDPGKGNEAEMAEALRRLEEGLRRARDRGAIDRPHEKTVLPAASVLVALDEPATSRLRLFRMFLDVLERPPTRAEEEELFPLAHADRWQKLLELAAASGVPKKPPEVEAAFLALLGRRPLAEELEDLSSELQAVLPEEWWPRLGLRLTAMPEYASTERRRARSPEQRARSFLVDFLDRAPRAGVEVEAVSAALADAALVARTLVYSPESGLAARKAVAVSLRQAGWEGEFFRFLLRLPNDRERQEIERILDAVPDAERRRWLAIALGLNPEYRRY